MKDEKTTKKLVEKLILRVYSTISSLWKACVSCPNGTVQLFDPGDVNLFFFYCQLLEVLLANVPYLGSQSQYLLKVNT